MRKVIATIYIDGRDPIEKEMWSEQCLYCGKLIEGYTPKQVKRLMFVHQLNCKMKRENKKIGDLK